MKEHRAGGQVFWSAGRLKLLILIVNWSMIIYSIFILTYSPIECNAGLKWNTGNCYTVVR
jgi:hypothetical protein